MRLDILEQAASWQTKILARMVGFLPGPGVVSNYRREFFGQYFMTGTRQWLTGDQLWSKGERELFAAFVSDLNQCKF